MAEVTNAAIIAPTTLDEAVKINKSETQKNRIQVSNTKKPLFFYLNLAKRYIKQHDDVELSALGMAIPTVVIIAEILKRNGLATEKRVLTSTVGSKDEAKGRLVQKAKIEIVLVRTENGAKSKSEPSSPPPKNSDDAAEEETPSDSAVTEPKKNADKE